MLNKKRAPRRFCILPRVPEQGEGFAGIDSESGTVHASGSGGSGSSGDPAQPPQRIAMFNAANLTAEFDRFDEAIKGHITSQIAALLAAQTALLERLSALLERQNASLDRQNALIAFVIVCAAVFALTKLKLVER